MDSTYCRNQWIVPLLVVGALLASTVLFLTFAQAAEEAQIQAAIKDLSSATGQSVTSEEQAKALCNQEQYLDICADIGKKHDLYTENEIGQVDAFLNEIKGQILTDIKACQDEECLIRVASQLAQKVQTSNPTLATNLKLTTTIIEQKNSVVQAAKEVGVNFRDCEAMNPDTAPIDLLRKCARLAKDARVQQYIPEEKRALAAQFEDSAMLKLREALAAGTYQCGDNTLEGCGNFCLNPTGTGGLPPVCAQIASEIFGEEGVRELEAAHQQVGQVKDYYSKKFVLTLPDGSEVVGDKQIRERCDRAFSNRNLEVARACGNFAVRNGFASQAEVDRGLKLMESFAQKGQNVDFDDCLADPTACRNFLPEDEVDRFDAGRQILEIMRTEIGFDPAQCERGAVDEAIGVKCFEGSKRALAKIESLNLAGQSQEARFIIGDIKKHVAEGENLTQRKDQFKRAFSQQGGPGGCRSEAECFTYCSDPVNGPECIAFGAQQGVSGFRGEEAVQRFNEYNQNIQKQSFQFSGQGSYPGFQPSNVPPGQIPGFTQPGPGFSPPPGISGFYPGPGSVGPSPECFSAIQSGDFVRAKEFCYVAPQPTGFPAPQICPLSPYIECPAGQYRESYQNKDSCWVDGPCKPIPTYSPGPAFTPSGDPVIECKRLGGVWDDNIKSCIFPDPLYSPGPGTGSCPTGYHYHSESSGFCLNDQENYGGTCYNAAGTGKITCPQPTYSPYPSPYPIYSPLPGTSYTPSTCPSGQWWDPAISACKSTTPSDTAAPYPSYTPYSGYCGDNVCSSSETSSSCPSDCGGGTTYTPYPTSAYTSPPSCPSGQYWDGQTCVTSSTPPPSTPDPAAACSSSGGSWNGSTCIFPTPPPAEEPPPPTSGIYPYYMATHCQQLGRTWNGKICEANGLFARFFENSGMANMLRLFYIIH